MTKIVDMKKWMDSPTFKNTRQKWTGKTRDFILGIGIAIIVSGVCYIILAPVIGIVSRAFMSPEDIGNPLVFLFPQNPSLYNIANAFRFMNYWDALLRTMIFSISLALVHVVITSFVGYGFARFKFPGSGLLFGLVVVSIIVPVQTYMIPMQINFRFFLGNESWSLLDPTWPWAILALTLTGVGIRSGLYIFIFRQFFRGIPKEIEEAAFIDGTGPLGTYLRIMMPNAVPAVVTVFLFAFVWHYNDTYYAGMLMTGNTLMASRLNAVGWTYSDFHDMRNPVMMQMITFGGVLLAIAPIMIIYLFLQRYFVEGLERSGIVG
ncbi:MAG: carbohydrate ABC transporter permease [Defluviitaleaceae bacterium]|nr:carbohydrate ABC transporter permease [Defluviitaleaceae bacterium]MCL2240274.1 carbohydrate ABC transporter permease [Defluviitaleaceae bacterium]